MQVSSVQLNRFYSPQKVDSNVALGNVSFGGNIHPRDSKQFLSIAPEHKGIGLKNYNEGGLACVAQEAPESWQADLGADVRSVLPYHASNNPKGMMKVAVLGNPEKLPDMLPADLSNVRNVDPNYVPRPNEAFVLINSSPEMDSKTKKPKGYKFIKLEPTEVKGTITTVSEYDLKTEPLDYKFFRQVLTQKEKDAGREPTYFVHTKQVALMPRCYGLGATYQTGQVAGQWWDLYYANFNRAVADALPKLAEKEDFNPANIWMHDRPAFAFQYEVAKRSANGNKFYDGLRMHSTLHNPGHSYQGYYENPLGFLRIAFDEKEFEKLQRSEDFYELKILDKKPVKKLTEAEKKRRDEILGGYLDKLLDDNKLPNITMMAVANSDINTGNSTVGTVSMNYGKEMKDKNLNGIADGLTDKLSGLKRTYDITNGNKPAALKLDVDSQFGAGGNGLTTDKENYTKYSPYLSEDGKVMNYSKEDRISETPEKQVRYQELKAIVKADEATDAEKKEKAKLDRFFALKSVKEAKQANKIWLVNLIGSCVDKNGKPDTQKIKELFYNAEQINEKKLRIHGYISPYQEGDKVFTSWGRSDEQKGFSTLVQGFYKYLSQKGDEKFESEKQHAKLLFGSGGLWKENSEEAKIIKTYIDKIRTMDGGKYSGNICYVEGFFPNKLVACSDWTIFTSRYEPCGITPLESFAAGVPVLSIRTGGAPDFVRHLDNSELSDSVKAGEEDKAITEDAVGDANGILTEHPFMLSPKTIKGMHNSNIDKDLDASDAQALDEARREVLSDEIANLFVQANATTEKVYDKMAKNACEQYIEWSNNGAYNNGSSANDRYMGEVFRLNPETLDYAETRSTKAMKKLTDEFGQITSPLEIDDDPILAAVRKYKTLNAEADSPSFKGVLKNYMTLSSIDTYSKAFSQKNA